MGKLFRNLIIVAALVGLLYPVYNYLRSTKAKYRVPREEKRESLVINRMEKMLYGFQDVAYTRDLNLISKYASKNYIILKTGMCEGAICDDIQKAFAILKKPYEGKDISDSDIEMAHQLIRDAQEKLLKK